MKSFLKTLIITSGLLTSICIGLILTKQISAKEIKWEYIPNSVESGDKFKAYRKVSLIGIPVSKEEKIIKVCGIKVPKSDEAFGFESKDFLAYLLQNSGDLVIESFGKKSNEKLLEAEVYLSGESPENSIAGKLVSAGLAKIIYGNPHALKLTIMANSCFNSTAEIDSLQKLSNQAKKNRTGIFENYDEELRIEKQKQKQAEAKSKDIETIEIPKSQYQQMVKDILMLKQQRENAVNFSIEKR